MCESNLPGEQRDQGAAQHQPGVQQAPLLLACRSSASRAESPEFINPSPCGGHSCTEDVHRTQFTASQERPPWRRTQVTSPSVHPQHLLRSGLGIKGYRCGSEESRLSSASDAVCL